MAEADEDDLLFAVGGGSKKAKCDLLLSILLFS
jgi:hypothetical protein